MPAKKICSFTAALKPPPARAFKADTEGEAEIILVTPASELAAVLKLFKLEAYEELKITVERA